ncbi:unnamed protein product [Merluccius merluccius]
MAELNRQLQEYLAQSKHGAKTASPSGPSTTVDLEAADAVPGSWFGRWSSPAQSPPGGGGSSWPWSSEPDPCLPGLSRRQRLAGCGLCLSLSALCFGLSALYAPLLLLYARKFALLWSLGSLFAIAAAGLLRGCGRPLGPPTPGAAVYLCALGGTLYAALGLHSTPLTALGAVVQIAVVAGYAVSLLPGGSAGIRLLGGVVVAALKRTVSGKTTPI